MILPSATSEEAFDAVRRDDAKFRAGVEAILCRHHVNAPTSIDRFAAGSRPVFAIGDHLVLKLFPPFEASFFETEKEILRAVSGRLPVPTPRLEASGYLDGWGYLLMTRLLGNPLAEAWEGSDASGLSRVAATIGESVAALHQLDCSTLGVAVCDWDSFVSEQRRNVVARQRALGLGDDWLEQIPGIIERLDPFRTTRRVLLHTELMREHFLVTEDGGRFRLSGLLDFEPSMVGEPEYELAAVGLFVSSGNSTLFRRILLSYGYREEELDTDLTMRCLAWTLLHRYCDIPWYLDRLPAGKEISSMEELASAWWSV